MRFQAEQSCSHLSDKNKVAGVSNKCFYEMKDLITKCCMINFQTSIADFVRFIPVLLPKQVKSEPKLGEIYVILRTFIINRVDFLTPFEH